ncbi:MAG: HPr family phosphocarrier protein [Negativibacillus sp.]
MTQYVQLNSKKEWTDFVKLAWQFDSDIGVHTDETMLDAKDMQEILSLDCKKPVRVVTEDKRFMRAIRSWAVKQPA